MKLYLLVVTGVAIALTSCSSDPLESQGPTLSLERTAQNNGMESPERLDDYTPVHAKDREYRVCYKTMTGPSAKPRCLVHSSEHGPAATFNGNCRGDNELPDGYAWCDLSYIQDEFELRYGEKTAFMPGMLRAAQRNGIEQPVRVDVGEPNANCFKQSLDDDANTICWFERIDPQYYGGINACGRGYAGSFWCTYGENGPPEHGLSVDSPVPLEGWTWLWTEPRS